MPKLLLIFCTLMLTPYSIASTSGMDEGPKLYFISPANGETLQSPVTVRFGLRNMGVAPAGSNIPNTGHHHLLIDTDLPAMDLPIGKDEQHVHFGGGQTETSIELSPGKHTMQLLLGNFSHIPQNPPVISKQITITVE